MLQFVTSGERVHLFGQQLLLGTVLRLRICQLHARRLQRRLRLPQLAVRLGLHYGSSS